MISDDVPELDSCYYVCNWFLVPLLCTDLWWGHMTSKLTLVMCCWLLSEHKLSEVCIAPNCLYLFLVVSFCGRCWHSWIYLVPQGDHVTFLNIYKGFHQSGKSSQWCYKNFLNHQALVCAHCIETIFHTWDCALIQCFLFTLLHLHILIWRKSSPFLLQKKVIDIREQLVRIIKRFGIPLTSCDRDMEVLFHISINLYWYLQDSRFH